MHPSVLNELLQSYRRQQFALQEERMRMRRLDTPDQARVGRPGSLLAKVAGWIGRPRPAHAR